MPTNERVMVMLPSELVREIDRLARDRGRFIEEAARHELVRRRRELLRQALDNPHDETAELVEAGFDRWAASLPEEDAASLVDPRSGTEVRWEPGEGWTQVAS